jgi:hypothetical protein
MFVNKWKQFHVYYYVHSSGFQGSDELLFLDKIVWTQELRLKQIVASTLLA